MYDFEARTPEDLSFKKGEQLEILNDDLQVGAKLSQTVIYLQCVQGDWWYARSRTSGHCGYIPANFIAPLNSIEAEP